MHCWYKLLRKHGGQRRDCAVDCRPLLAHRGGADRLETKRNSCQKLLNEMLKCLSRAEMLVWS